jgi:transposase InsO family protein
VPRKGQPSDVHQAMQCKCQLPYISCSVVSGKSIHTIRKVLPPGLGYDLTHASLGHMCSAKVKRLVSEEYIEASNGNGNDTFTCSACETANAKKESYHSQHDLSATHVNHTLHADLLHFPTCTPDGQRYLLVVVDEFTRYCFVALLALKSEAASHLLRIMKRAYVLHTIRVKNLRTDFGGEFKNTVMRIAKEELGIADEHVPANCHESNGLVERLNLTLASTVRAVLTKAHLLVTQWGEAALYVGP